MNISIRLSTDKYLLKSDFDPNKILQLVRENTLNHSLVMTSTNRNFIGRIGNNSFKIISSSKLPYGATCVVSGEINANSLMEIQTSLHKVFRVLFLVWLVFLIGSGIIIGFEKEWTYTELLGQSLLFFVLAILFRLYMHGMYVWARNHSIKRLSLLLDSTLEKV